MSTVAENPVEFERLAERLERRFAAGVDSPWTEEEFEALALEVFRYQFEENHTFRAFCEARGRTPDSVTRWTEVPVVPARAFKHLDLRSAPGAEAVFRTSGTSTDGERRGVHTVPRLSLYEASLIPAFQCHLVPESGRLPFVSLIPSPAELRDSSLSHMIGVAADRLASRVAWVVDGAGEVDAAGLAEAIGQARSEATPVLLVGTAFAFVNLLDRPDVALGPLPEGSRVMETGGFKGRSREVPRDELYGALSAAAGLPTRHIVNEYGMTELLSQMYASGTEDGPGPHDAPPWLRVRVLDPTSLEELPEGERGILAFYDLANLGSVAHLLTEDVGRLEGGRLRLEGRAAGAEPRGCSRAMDDLMGAAR